MTRFADDAAVAFEQVTSVGYARPRERLLPRLAEAGRRLLPQPPPDRACGAAAATAALAALGDGWHVLRDLDPGGAWVDHLAVGPAGLFTVGATGRREGDAGDPSQRRLDEAVEHAAIVARLTGRTVHPLLVFPEGAPPRVLSHDGVIVMPAVLLAGHLDRRPVVLTPAEAEALHQRLLLALAA